MTENLYSHNHTDVKNNASFSEPSSDPQTLLPSKSTRRPHSIRLIFSLILIILLLLGALLGLKNVLAKPLVEAYLTRLFDSRVHIKKIKLGLRDSSFYIDTLDIDDSNDISEIAIRIGRVEGKLNYKKVMYQKQIHFSTLALNNIRFRLPKDPKILKKKCPNT